jgi:hypothetical protein
LPAAEATNDVQPSSFQVSSSSSTSAKASSSASLPSSSAAAAAAEAVPAAAEALCTPAAHGPSDWPHRKRQLLQQQEADVLSMLLEDAQVPSFSFLFETVGPL